MYLTHALFDERVTRSIAIHNIQYPCYEGTEWAYIMKKNDDDDDGDITRTGRLHKRKFKRGPGIGERVPRIISLRREFHRGNE